MGTRINSFIFYLHSYYFYMIQGFSERLVTTSRPGIGLMFKQVSIFKLFWIMLPGGVYGLSMYTFCHFYGQQLQKILLSLSRRSKFWTSLLLSRSHLCYISIFIKLVYLFLYNIFFLNLVILSFMQTLDVLLQVLVIFPKVEPLRNKVRIRYDD